jgi:hypothetical protein
MNSWKNVAQENYLLPLDLLLRLGRDITRVILLANNAELSLEDIEKLGVSRHDLVVQFNACMYHEILSRKSCSYMFFFREHFDTGTHHGFPCPATIVQDAIREPRRYFFIFTGKAPQPGLWSYPALQARTSVLDADYVTARLPDYPLQAGVPFAAPSSGFLLLRLLLLIKNNQFRPTADDQGQFLRRIYHLCQRVEDLWRFRNSSRFSLELVGFSPTREGTFWNGHSWDYERTWLVRNGCQRGAMMVHVNDRAS